MGKLVSVSINNDLFRWECVGNEYKRVTKLNLLNEEDTYIAGIGSTNRLDMLDILRKNVNVLYESPLTLNFFHKERTEPSQRIIIFEKKCPVADTSTTKPVLDVETTGGIHMETT